MMITNDKIYAKALGIFYLLDSFDAAIKDNNKFYTCFMGKVYSFQANTISFIVAIWYVVVDIRIELLQKLVHQCDCCASVYIVISVYENTFLASHCIVEAVYGYIHVFHQKWVDEVGELWTEKTFGCRLSRNAPMDEKLCQNRTHAQLICQFFSRFLLFWCRFFVIPFKMHFNYFLFLPQSYKNKMTNEKKYHGI